MTIPRREHRPAPRPPPPADRSGKPSADRSAEPSNGRGGEPSTDWGGEPAGDPPRQLSRRDAKALERCLVAGGVAVFPADTVYGIACDPESRAAVARLYELKGRPAERPAAVMFFSERAALTAVPELGERTCAALERLLPGPLTLLLPNPGRRFPLACGPEPERLGVRVPDLPERLWALRAVVRPLLQSSANRSGGADARRLEDVDPSLRGGVDLALDGGELPGTPSTVIDLTGFEAGGTFTVVREGAVPRTHVTELLAGA